MSFPCAQTDRCIGVKCSAEYLGCIYSALRLAARANHRRLRLRNMYANICSGGLRLRTYQRARIKVEKKSRRAGGPQFIHSIQAPMATYLERQSDNRPLNSMAYDQFSWDLQGSEKRRGFEVCKAWTNDGVYVV